MPDEVLSAIDKVATVCRNNGIISGCASLGAANAKVIMEKGVQFVTVSSDVSLIRRGAAADVAETRQWIDRHAKART